MINKKHFVQEFFLNGSIKSEWETPTAATSYSDLNSKDVKMACNGNVKTYGGSIWKWKYPELR